MRQGLAYAGNSGHVHNWNGLVITIKNLIEKRRKIMAKGYWVSCYRAIKNADAMGEYAKLAGPAVASGGGTFLARGGRIEAFEAGVKERTVVVELTVHAVTVVVHGIALLRNHWRHRCITVVAVSGAR